MRSSEVELLVAIVRVPGLSSTKKLVHAKRIAFLNDLLFIVLINVWLIFSVPTKINTLSQTGLINNLFIHC